MAATYEPIASTTLGASAADITFTSIPGGWTDIALVITGDTTGASWVGLVCQVNGDTGSNYSETYLYGDGSAAGSGRASSAAYMNLGAISATNPSPNTFQFMSYSNTNVFKTVLAASGITDGWVKRAVGLWRSTSAITSIKVYHPTDSLASGTVAAIYGIKAA
jgi:hypothetical protein